VLGISCVRYAKNNLIHAQLVLSGSLVGRVATLAGATPDKMRWSVNRFKGAWSEEINSIA